MDTSAVIEDILEHHGVLGMRWGHRSARSENVGISPRKQKKIAKKDAAFEKRANAPITKIALHNSINEAANKDITAINNKPQYQAAIAARTLLSSSAPITQKYHQEIMDSYIGHLNKAANELTNASGTKKYAVVPSDDDFLGFNVHTVDVKHGEIPDLSFRVNFVKDSNGMITGLVLARGDLAQSAIDDILEHHGVKGMRWGLRRKATVGAQEVIVSDKRKKLKTSGGVGHPSHSDAVSARTSGQIAKKSGVKSLSNKQLEDYNKRVNLEQNFKRLSYHDKPAAQRFALKLIGQTGKQTAQNAANEVASQQVKKALIKAALVAA